MINKQVAQLVEQHYYLACGRRDHKQTIVFGSLVRVQPCLRIDSVDLPKGMTARKDGIFLTYGKTN